MYKYKQGVQFKRLYLQIMAEIQGHDIQLGLSRVYDYLKIEIFMFVK